MRIITGLGDCVKDYFPLDVASYKMIPFRIGYSPTCIMQVLERGLRMWQWLSMFSATLTGAFIGSWLYVHFRVKRYQSPRARSTKIRVYAGETFESRVKNGLELRSRCHHPECAVEVKDLRGL